MKLPYDPVFEDRALSHQIVLKVDGRHSQVLTVGCNCTGGMPIAAKSRWAPGEALALYRTYHKGR